MPFLNYPDGTVVILPQFSRAWVCIVRNRDGSGALVPAINAEDLLNEATAFLNSLGSTDLDGGAIRECPPELAAKAVFPDEN